MRIAFITTEFPTEHANRGGLGNYLNRITRALHDMGHQPEVFVASRNEPATIDYHGVVVHRVGLFRGDTFLCKAINYVLYRMFRDLWSGPAGYLNCAWHLGRAVALREREVRFDLIHSTSCSSAGLFIKKNTERPHVLRLSSKRDLLCEVDGKKGFGFGMMSFLEKLSARRADVVYAPSRFIARECTEKWKVKTKVLRPPAFIEASPAHAIPFDLPGRFMIHFGIFSRKKGSIFLARALKTVWEHAPDFTMVWCGYFPDDAVRRECFSLFGAHASKIRMAGELEKEVLYAVIQKSTAAVLPSLADNLPNTVIESLLLGVPVIGTYGCSIDELVENTVTGMLVRQHDEQSLADALLSVWNGSVVFDMRAVHKNSTFQNMEPVTAAGNLVNLNFE